MGLFEIRDVEYHVWIIELDIPNGSADFKAVSPEGKVLTKFIIDV